MRMAAAPAPGSVARVPMRCRWGCPRSRQARGCRVQHAIAVPLVLEGSEIACCLGAEGRDRGAIASRQRALPDDDQRPLGVLEDAGEIVSATDHVGQRLRSGTEIFVWIG